MGNVKGHALRVDWVNTPKVRELDTQIKQYSNTYNLGDFTSDDDIPNLRAVKAVLGSVGAVYSVYVSAENGLVIDWQNDLIDGVKTYVEVSGNNAPKAFHYFAETVGSVTTLTRGGVEPVVVIDSGLITTVTFDWGYVADALIVF